MLTADQQLGQLGQRFRGKRYVQGHANKAYVRFTDLRDACMVFSSLRHGGYDWRVDFVSPDLWQVSTIPGHIEYRG